VAQAALDAQAQGRTLEKVRLMAGRTLEIVFDAEVDGATPEPAPQVQAVAEGDAPSVSTSLSIEETPCV
jgi:predicted RNase H-like HicB family nuclease